MATALGTANVTPSRLGDGVRHFCSEHKQYLDNPIHVLDPRTKENMVACPLCFWKEITIQHIRVTAPLIEKHQCHSLSDCKLDGKYTCHHCGMRYCYLHMGSLGPTGLCKDCTAEDEKKVDPNGMADGNQVCAAPHCTCNSVDYCKWCEQHYCDPHMSKKLLNTCLDCEKEIG